MRARFIRATYGFPEIAGRFQDGNTSINLEDDIVAATLVTGDKK